MDEIEKAFGDCSRHANSFSRTLRHTTPLCCLLPWWRFVGFLCPQVICGHSSPHLMCHWSYILPNLFLKRFFASMQTVFAGYVIFPGQLVHFWVSHFSSKKPIPSIIIGGKIWKKIWYNIIIIFIVNLKWNRHHFVTLHLLFTYSCISDFKNYSLSLTRPSTCLHTYCKWNMMQHYVCLKYRILLPGSLYCSGVIWHYNSFAMVSVLIPS